MSTTRKLLLVCCLLVGAWTLKAVDATVRMLNFDQQFLINKWADGKTERIDNPNASLTIDEPTAKDIRLTPWFRVHVRQGLVPNEMHVGAVLVMEASAPGTADIQIHIRGDRAPSKRFKARFAAGKQTLRFAFDKPEMCMIAQVRLMPDKPGLKATLYSLDKIVQRPIQACFNLNVKTPLLPYYIVTPKTYAPTTLTLENYTDKPFTGRVALHFDNAIPEDAFDMNIDKPVTIPAHATIDLGFPKTLKYGSWTVTGKLVATDGSNVEVPIRTLFGYMQPNYSNLQKNPDGFRFGIGDCEMKTYTTYWQEKDADFQAMIGFNMLRTEAGWAILQPKNDTEWNDKELITLIDRYKKRNFLLTMLLGGTTPWAVEKNLPPWRVQTPPRNPFCAVPNLEKYEKFLRRFVHQFNKDVWAYESWNEPDNEFFAGTLADLREVMQVIRKVTREEDPKSRVMLGGFAAVRNGDMKPGLVENAIVNFQDYYDIVAHHQHGMFFEMAANMDARFFPIFERAKIKPVWLANETAWAPLSPGNEYMQGEMYYKKALYVKARGGLAHFWFCFRNYGFDEGFPPWNYGLLTYDARPKPGLLAANATIGLFRNTDFVKQHDFGDKSCWVFEFKGDDGILLATWVEADIKKALSPKLYKTDAKEIISYDLYGNPRKEPMKNGVFILQPNLTCRSILLKGATYCQPIDALLNVDCKFTDNNGFEAVVTLKNAFPETAGKKMPFVVSFQPPDGITLDNAAPATLNIATGEKATVNFRGKLTDMDAIREAVVLKNVVRMKTEGLGDVEISSFTARPALPLGPGYDPAHPTKPDFVLDKVEQNVSVWQANPAGNHLVWKGPDDLSVKLWLWIDKGWLKVHADVTDDFHVTNPVDTMRMRDGDCLQLIIDSDNIQEFWWFLLTLQKDKNLRGHLVGHGYPENIKAIYDQMIKEVKRVDNHTIYDLAVPLKLLKISEEDCYAGRATFDFMISDNDGEGLEGWMQLTRGGAREKLEERFLPVRYYDNRKK